MTTKTKTTERTEINSLTLTGRVTSAPEVRALPSGDELVAFRLSVPRLPSTTGARQAVDWFDCAAWGGRARISAMSWTVGDTVRIEGALRRRHFRTDGPQRSRVEVEVLSGRRVTRAGRGGQGESGRAAAK